MIKTILLMLSLVFSGCASQLALSRISQIVVSTFFKAGILRSLALIVWSVNSPLSQIYGSDSEQKTWFSKNLSFLFFCLATSPSPIHPQNPSFQKTSTLCRIQLTSSKKSCSSQISRRG